jgi:hypothetical protein
MAGATARWALATVSEKAGATMNAIEKAAKALARLSDSEWARVKDAEDRRRLDQHTIRDLAQRYRELHPEPARSPPACRHRGGAS